MSNKDERRSAERRTCRLPPASFLSIHRKPVDFPNPIRYTRFDAEVAALIAPRALYLDGNERDMFPPEQVRREFARLQPFYEAAGAADRLLLYIGEGGHEVAKGEQGFRFFTEHL